MGTQGFSPIPSVNTNHFCLCWCFKSQSTVFQSCRAFVGYTSSKPRINNTSPLNERTYLCSWQINVVICQLIYVISNVLHYFFFFLQKWIKSNWTIKHCKTVVIWHMGFDPKKPVFGFANNKDAEQPAQMRSLISTFLIGFMESIISKLATSKISIF